MISLLPLFSFLRKKGYYSRNKQGKEAYHQQRRGSTYNNPYPAGRLPCGERVGRTRFCLCQGSSKAVCGQGTV